MDDLLKFTGSKEFVDNGPFIDLHPGAEITAPGQDKIKAPVLIIPK